jgi:hypothetical protein
MKKLRSFVTSGFITITFFCLLVIPGCKRDKYNTPVIQINSSMMAGFGYKTGTYWIYRDSLSGEVDSAWVSASSVYTDQTSCVLSNDMPRRQFMNINVTVSHNDPSVAEAWYFHMADTTFTINLANNRDSIESGLGFTLFHYPLAKGDASYSSGCVGGRSGGFTDIIPELSVGSQGYSNSARSTHNLNDSIGNYYYNDLFYVNENAGIVKLVFNHPHSSVHRVLELQRCKIVK